MAVLQHFFIVILWNLVYHYIPKWQQRRQLKLERYRTDNRRESGEISLILTTMMYTKHTVVIAVVYVSFKWVYLVWKIKSCLFEGESIYTFRFAYKCLGVLLNMRKNIVKPLCLWSCVKSDKYLQEMSLESASVGAKDYKSESGEKSLDLDRSEFTRPL